MREAAWEVERLKQSNQPPPELPDQIPPQLPPMLDLLSVSLSIPDPAPEPTRIQMTHFLSAQRQTAFNLGGLWQTAVSGIPARRWNYSRRLGMYGQDPNLCFWSAGLKVLDRFLSLPDTLRLWLPQDVHHKMSSPKTVHWYRTEL